MVYAGRTVRARGRERQIDREREKGREGETEKQRTEVTLIGCAVPSTFTVVSINTRSPSVAQTERERAGATTVSSMASRHGTRVTVTGTETRAVTQRQRH